MTASLFSPLNRTQSFGQTLNTTSGIRSGLIILEASGNLSRGGGRLLPNFLDFPPSFAIWPYHPPEPIHALQLDQVEPFPFRQKKHFWNASKGYVVFRYWIIWVSVHKVLNRLPIVICAWATHAAVFPKSLAYSRTVYGCLKWLMACWGSTCNLRQTSGSILKLGLISAKLNPSLFNPFFLGAQTYWLAKQFIATRAIILKYFSRSLSQPNCSFGRINVHRFTQLLAVYWSFEYWVFFYFQSCMKFSFFVHPEKKTPRKLTVSFNRIFINITLKNSALTFGCSSTSGSWCARGWIVNFWQRKILFKILFFKLKCNKHKLCFSRWLLMGKLSGFRQIWQELGTKQFYIIEKLNSFVIYVTNVTNWWQSI